METPDLSPPPPPPPYSDSSRPSLGFPLGTALLLLLIFTLSGIISCCYHWDKLTSLRRSSSSSSASLDLDKDRRTETSLVSVVMPGDLVPKFIAIPCPRQPPKPPKPPRIVVPFY